VRIMPLLVLAAMLLLKQKTRPIDEDE